MNLKLKEKVNESLSAILPITAIVLLISIFITPVELGNIVRKKFAQAQISSFYRLVF